MTEGQRRVLIAGVSGVVGFAAAQTFAAAGWEVVGLSRRKPGRLDQIDHVSVDLNDREATAQAVAAIGPVTHLVYAALFEKPGLIPGWFEADQMDRNQTMLANLYEPLADQASLQHVSLLQGTKAYGPHVEPMKVPGREREARHQHANFYWLQEDYLLDQQRRAASRPGASRRGAWNLTIVRPQVIFGEAQGGNMNALPAIGVYAAMLRAAGEPLHYPGGVAPLSEAVDADVVAQMLLWAATTPAAANETFNVTNGDVYTMRNVWPTIADAFGMDVGDDRSMSLARELPGRESEWTKIVANHRLAAPASLDAFVGQSFIYADLLMGFGRTELSPPTLVSTIKARQRGFVACVDTEDMFVRLIDRFQQAQLLPPR